MSNSPYCTNQIHLLLPFPPTFLYTLTPSYPPNLTPNQLISSTSQPIPCFQTTCTYRMIHATYTAQCISLRHTTLITNQTLPILLTQSTPFPHIYLINPFPKTHTLSTRVLYTLFTLPAHLYAVFTNHSHPTQDILLDTPPLPPTHPSSLIILYPTQTSPTLLPTLLHKPTLQTYNKIPPAT